MTRMNVFPSKANVKAEGTPTSSIFGSLFGAGGGSAIQAGLVLQPKQLTPKEIAEAKEGGLGPRWPKGMWDNMDGNT